MSELLLADGISLLLLADGVSNLLLGEEDPPAPTGLFLLLADGVSNLRLADDTSQLEITGVDPPPPTPIVTMNISSTHAVYDVALTIGVSIADPAPGTTTVTLAATVAGVWTPGNVVELSSSVLSANVTFLPTALGATIFSGTLDNGATGMLSHNFYFDGYSYYISTAGNDSNNGQSALVPFQTVAGARAYHNTWLRGASYQFRGGDIFSATAIVVNDANDGSDADDIITFMSYGTGQAVLRHIESSSVTVFSSLNCGGITLDNLEVYGAGASSNLSTQRLIDFGMSAACPFSVLYNFTVTNCTIHDGHFGIYARPEYVGIAPKLSSVTLTDNTLYDIGRRGMTLGMLSTTTGVDATWCTGVRIQNNSIVDVGDTNNGSASALGMIISYLTDFEVSGNLVHDIGKGDLTGVSTSGIVVWGMTDGGVVRGNEVYNVFMVDVDGIGINLDTGNQNVFVEYNYVHDCDSAGLSTFTFPAGATPAGYGLWRNNVYRYNVVQNCAKVLFGSFWTLGGDQDGCLVYNNTFIQTSVVAGTAIVGYDSTYSASTLMKNFKFYNNIFYGASNGVVMIDMPAAAGNQAETFFLNNSYFPVTGTAQIKWFGTSYNTVAAWVAAATNKDIGAVTADPQLATPTTPIIIDNPGLLYMRLTSGRPGAASPVIGAGLNLRNAPYSFTGITHDFRGRRVPGGTAFDLGAFELVRTSGNFFGAG